MRLTIVVSFGQGRRRPLAVCCVLGEWCWRRFSIIEYLLGYRLGVQRVRILNVEAIRSRFLDKSFTSVELHLYNSRFKVTMSFQEITYILRIIAQHAKISSNPQCLYAKCPKSVTLIWIRWRHQSVDGSHTRCLTKSVQYRYSTPRQIMRRFSPLNQKHSCIESRMVATQKPSIQVK